MRSALALVLISCAAIAGCARAVSQQPVSDEYFDGYVATLIGSTLDVEPIVDEPDTPDVPRPDSDVCPNCNGKGVVGDGRIFTMCLECDGTGKIRTEITPDPLDLPIEEPTIVVSQPYQTTICENGVCRTVTVFPEFSSTSLDSGEVVASSSPVATMTTTRHRVITRRRFTPIRNFVSRWRARRCR